MDHDGSLNIDKNKIINVSLGFVKTEVTGALEMFLLHIMETMLEKQKERIVLWTFKRWSHR